MKLRALTEINASFRKNFMIKVRAWISVKFLFPLHFYPLQLLTFVWLHLCIVHYHNLFQKIYNRQDIRLAKQNIKNIFCPILLNIVIHVCVWPIFIWFDMDSAYPSLIFFIQTISVEFKWLNFNKNISMF